MEAGGDPEQQLHEQDEQQQQDEHQHHHHQQQQQRAAAIIARHRERIAVLEDHKRCIQELSTAQLAAWVVQQAAAAATTIQAAWRAHRVRRALPPPSPQDVPQPPARCCSQSRSSAPDDQVQQAGSPAGAAEAAMRGSTCRQQSGVCREESSGLLDECSQLSVVSASSAAGTAPALAGKSRCHHKVRALPTTAHRLLLERQVQTCVDAAGQADASRLEALRACQADCDARLAQLLQQRNEAEAGALQDTRRRQRTLHKAELLYQQLRQLPSQLPAAGDVSTSSALPPGAARMLAQLPKPVGSQRAQQAHALALGEARGTGSRWWLALNRLHATQGPGATGTSKVSGAAAGGVKEYEWSQLQAACRRNWECILAAEQQRR